MNILIACAGSQHKWKNHLGVPSHLVPDRTGEAILHRTVRQCNERGFRPLVLAPADERYSVPDSDHRWITGVKDTEFDSARDALVSEGTNVLLLGDTWFSDEALDRILNEEGEGFTTYGRHGPSGLTGSPWGEIFGYSWPGSMNSVVLEHNRRVVEAFRARRLPRKTGWEVLYSFQGVDMLHKKPGGCKHITDPEFFVEIKDLTDDIDFPVDYDKHPMFGGNQ